MIVGITRKMLCTCASLLLVSIAQADSVQRLTKAYLAGVAAYDREAFGDAAVSFELSLSLAPQVYGRGRRGPTARDTAQLMKRLADCYQQTGRLNAAMDLYQQAYSAFSRETGATSQETLLCQEGMAAIHRKRSQWSEAERLYRIALDGLSDPIKRATTAKKLARVYLNQDRLDEAEKFFRISMSLAQSQSEVGTAVEVSSAKHGLGMVAHRRGRHLEAEALLTEVLRERSRLLPKHDRRTAQTMGMLAAVYSATERDHLARPLLEQTVQVMTTHWRDPQHIEVATEKHELALLLAREREVDKASQLMDQSRRAFHRHITGTLLGLSQHEQLRFLETERGRLIDAIAMASQNRDHHDLESQSLEWVLNFKGVSQEVLAQRELLAREAAGDSKMATVAKELNAIRQSLASSAIAADAPSQRKALQKLIHQEHTLSKRLAAVGASWQSEGSWVDASRVANALPSDGCFVEILRLDRSTPRLGAYEKLHSRDDTPAYVAWIVSAKRESRLIRLGSSREIDSAIQVLQHEFSGDTAAKQIQFDPDSAFESIKEKLRSVSKRVLWPLLPSLAGYSHWSISPDTQLWLVPWSALILPDGRFAVEKVSLSHHVSGRDLLRRTQRFLPSDYGYILADPDFDFIPGNQQSVSTKPLDRIAQDPFSTRSEQRLLSSVPRDWRSLPGTEREAQLVGKPISSLIGKEVYLLKREDALEGHVKRSLPRPKVVVLATHAFFREPDERLLTDPMMRCGLVLSGANKRPSNAQDGDDGILTGLEILQLDFRGTELVALSACDTGQGQVTHGEGVMGLRQAFHLAGAKRVLSTLWEASDHYTPVLMSSFWEAMNLRLGVTKSLRKAQLDLIAELRSEGENPHPWFWAPVTLTTVGSSK